MLAESVLRTHQNRGNCVVEAQVIYTGSSSMHISINVFSRNLKQPNFDKKTHCIIVFVAVDENGKNFPFRNGFRKQKRKKTTRTVCKTSYGS
jgi:acyl-CoA hydrolase